MQQTLPNPAPAAATGTAVAFVLLVASYAGLPMTAPVAAALILLAVATISWLAPRWAESRGLLVEHPAGVATAAAAALTWIVQLAGGGLTPEAATLIVGGVTFFAGLLTPRSQSAASDGPGL